jgi:hypothetical protein
MKLAEALIERADLQNKAAQIKSRINHNAKVQEGDEPVEDAMELLRQYDAIMQQLEAVISRINRTNAATAFEGGTISDAIAKRDCLKTKINTYRELCEQASIVRERDSWRDGANVKFTRCVDVAGLRAQIDDMSKQYRELDKKMQGANWTTDLL